MNMFAIKGDIVYTKEQHSFTCIENGYVLCKDGICQGVVSSLSDNPDFINTTVIDHTGKLIIPGFVDIHVHAPQYGFRGMGMDLPLMDWLQTYTFPEESNYKNAEYAEPSYNLFVNDLVKSATTRASIFATAHLDSTMYLARQLEKSGIKAFLGKVNMDQNSTDVLNEDTEKSLEQTEIYIQNLNDFKNIKPIITPRFVPSCSSALLQGLGKIATKHSLPIQSHLSENYGEIEFVKNLYPKSKHYADVYDSYSLLDNKTIMAHCVHVTNQEQSLLSDKNTLIAHCPQSNTNLTSGVAPVSNYLKNGLKVALGSDVAGGASLNMFKAGMDAMQASKLRSHFLAQVGVTEDILSPSQVMFMLTKAGGEFFENSFGEKSGSFEKGYAFDALVIDDKSFSAFSKNDSIKQVSKSMVLGASLGQRVERLFYLADDRHIVEKYVSGVRI